MPPQQTDGGALPPVLIGLKALVVGVANDRSIAWGCAQAMRRAGAEIAMTYLNEKARPHVEPLARAGGENRNDLPKREAAPACRAARAGGGRTDFLAAGSARAGATRGAVRDH